MAHDLADSSVETGQSRRSVLQVIAATLGLAAQTRLAGRGSTRSEQSAPNKQPVSTDTESFRLVDTRHLRHFERGYDSRVLGTISSGTSFMAKLEVLQNPDEVHVIAPTEQRQ